MEYLRKLLGQKDPNAAEEFFANDPTMVQEVDYTERPTEQADSELFKRNVDRAINDPYAGSDMSPEVEAEATRRSQEMADAAEAERVAFESQQSQPERTPAAEPPKSKEQMLLEEFQKMRKDSDERLKSAETMDAFGNLLNVISPMVENRRRAKAIQSAQSLGADPGSFMPKIDTDNASRVLAGRQAKINELLQEQKLMAALQPKPMSKLDAAKIRESEAKAKMYEAKSGPSAAKTEGEKVLDREFAKEYNKWQTGGKVDYVENKKIFEEAIDAIKKDKVDTGLLSGAGSKLPLVRTNTKQLETRVRKAINGMLRATLGAQFTQDEGERIFSQTFDPSADEEENIKNMQTELAKIEGRAKALEGQGKYFRENKTLTGYEPSDTLTPSIDPTIEQYAKQNNINYEKAERILKSRGYNAK